MGKVRVPMVCATCARRGWCDSENPQYRAMVKDIAENVSWCNVWIPEADVILDIATRGNGQAEVTNGAH